MVFGQGKASVQASKGNPLARGYCCGGEFGTSSDDDRIERLNYAIKVNTNLGITLSQGRDQLSGVNSDLRGWCFGGVVFPSTTVTTIDGLIFATETDNNPSATLSPAARNREGVSDSDGGLIGIIAGGTLAVDTADKWTYATEARAAITGTLDNGKTNHFHFDGTLGIGYWAGGVNGGIQQGIDGIDFGTETSDHPGVNLADGIRTQGYSFSSSTNGYAVGGWSNVAPVFRNSIDSFNFSSETSATETATIGNYDRGAGYQSVSDGYAVGGTLGAGSVKQDDIQEYSFVDDTLTTLSTTLSRAKAVRPTGVQSWPQT